MSGKEGMVPKIVPGGLGGQHVPLKIIDFNILNGRPYITYSKGGIIRACHWSNICGISEEICCQLLNESIPPCKTGENRWNWGLPFQINHENGICRCRWGGKHAVSPRKPEGETSPQTPILCAGGNPDKVASPPPGTVALRP